MILSSEIAMGAEWIGGVAGGVFRWGDPEHNPFFPCCLARQSNLTGN